MRASVYISFHEIVVQLLFLFSGENVSRACAHVFLAAICICVVNGAHPTDARNYYQSITFELISKNQNAGIITHFAMLSFCVIIDEAALAVFNFLHK